MHPVINPILAIVCILFIILWGVHQQKEVN